jgi:hypothetical protein
MTTDQEFASIMRGGLAPRPNERSEPPVLEERTCDEGDCPRRHWRGTDLHRHHAAHLAQEVEG